MFKLSSLISRLSGTTSGINIINTMQTAMFASAPEMIKVEKVGQKQNVALITLNRPKALNALCGQLMEEVGIRQCWEGGFHEKILLFTNFETFSWQYLFESGQQSPLTIQMSVTKAFSEAIAMMRTGMTDY
uniref:3-hydroxyisobutyryl-CoA hydrolase, mitochondrial n=1 Tax=Heterorhabditis bacteriophora TaxID=37862 RepID=A0A1I7WPM0_HETBA